MPRDSARQEPDTDLRGKSWWLAIATLLAILWALYQDSGDPFGLDTFLETLSANAYTTITAPFYGKSIEMELEGKPYSSRLGQSEIVVLLIDDRYLDTTHQTWPISPGKYKRLLRKLSQADAAAVFFDIYFAPGDAEKTREVEKLFQSVHKLEQRSATRFFFASTLQDPELTAHYANPPRAALAQTTSAQNVYPLAQSAGDKTVDTAGWALYQAWCQRAANRQYCPDNFQHDPEDAIYLLWGYAPNEVMTELPEFAGGRCPRQSQTLLQKMDTSLHIFGWLATMGYQQEGERGSSGGVSNTLAPCPYHTQINLQLFNKLTSAELGALLKDKIVVIGTSLQLHTDYQVSPVHGYVSGAFWHATATDNLIEFGTGFLREAGEYEGAEQVGIVALIAINAILSLLIIQIDRRRSTSEVQVQWLQVTHGVFVFCAISATVLWFVWHSRVSPANWVGLALLMLMIAGESIYALWSRLSAWRPLPIAEPNLSAALNGLKGAVLCGVVLVVCYIVFLLPQGIFLSREPVADTLCWAVFLVFSAGGLGCVIFIARQWQQTRRLDGESSHGDGNRQAGEEFPGQRQ